MRWEYEQAMKRDNFAAAVVVGIVENIHIWLIEYIFSIACFCKALSWNLCTDKQSFSNTRVHKQDLILSPYFLSCSFSATNLSSSPKIVIWVVFKC